MEDLLEQIRQCRVCESFLANGANPVMTASTKCKILIIGQAPGKIVHHTGIPWNDKSGDNLRDWMGIGKATFYDTDLISLMPMGFCYPGKNKTGDLPPRKECAPLWHKKLIMLMPDVKLVLLVGQYAQNYYLGNTRNSTLTETVSNFQSHLPQYFPLPHPSPRNNIWQSKNKWFAADVLPELKKEVNLILHPFIG